MNKKLNILLPTVCIFYCYSVDLYTTVFIFFEQLIGLTVAQTNHHQASESISNLVSFSQSKYRVRVEIGGVYLPSQLERTPQLFT
jgi:hypothetical protein